MQHTRTRTGRVYEYFVCHRRRDTVCQQRKVLPVAQVEQRVQDLYRTIELNAGQRERIEQIVLAKLHRQQAVNGQRLEAITVEAQTVEANHAKLLEAYYADAIDRELFLTHQRRLSTEQAGLVRERAKLETANTEIRRRVRDALDLLQDVHATYADAPVTVRKQLNRAIFAEIFLGPEPSQIRAELNEPFASITQPGWGVRAAAMRRSKWRCPTGLTVRARRVCGSACIAQVKKPARLVQRSGTPPGPSASSTAPLRRTSKSILATQVAVVEPLRR